MSDETITKWTKYVQKQVGKKNVYPYIFEKIEGGILYTVAECPLIKQGQNKGEPNFRKRKNITKVFIPSSEV